MSICTNCNGKGYNTIYKGEGGYTDFGPMKYIETTPMGIQKVPCSKCQIKEETTELEKQTTGQTVYEQLQELQEKIAMRGGDIEYCKKCMSVIEYEQESPNYYREYCNTCKKDSYINGTIKKAYYHPISLAGVLSALGKMGMFSYTPGHIEQYHVDGKWQTICLRKLLNESGEDAYLDEQSDGTIKVLHELLVRK